MALASGTKLGPYEILSALGAGGMGEVYRARDPRLGREVAIKVRHSGSAPDSERLRRFEQEARAMKQPKFERWKMSTETGMCQPFLLDLSGRGIPTRRRSITVLSPVRTRQYALAWRPVGTPAGSNDSWPSCSLSCGSEMRADIRTRRVRKQKTDRQDAQLILRLLLEDRFPKIWVPSWENRDLRQLLWHRHRMVQARTRIMNQLQAVALNEGLRCKKRLWRIHGREQLESFRLAPWASRRRRDLLELMDRLNPTIAELSQAIEQEVEKCPEARRLMTHPGVGPLTALAFVLIIGEADRFQCGKQVASYLGLVPLEDSSGNRRRLGHITKQGSSMLRFLLVEAAQVTVRSLPEWRSKYLHLMMRRGRKIAKVAMARKLAVRLYWLMRQGWDYQQWSKFGSHAGQPGNRHGVQSNTE